MYLFRYLQHKWDTQQTMVEVHNKETFISQRKFIQFFDNWMVHIKFILPTRLPVVVILYKKNLKSQLTANINVIGP